MIPVDENDTIWWIGAPKLWESTGDIVSLISNVQDLIIIVEIIICSPKLDNDIFNSFQSDAIIWISSFEGAPYDDQ
jgi:hypothetical protein